MKRHPALVLLSRDHHDVLLLAQELKIDHPGYVRSVVPKTLPEKISYTKKFLTEYIQPHFRLEEDILLKGIAGISKELDEASQDIINDHRRIEALAEMLTDEHSLDALGRALEQHTRREEREFFQLVQEVLTAEHIEEIGRAMKQAVENREA